jgi:dihydropteroate synthase
MPHHLGGETAAGDRPAPALRLGDSTLEWRRRTYIMGIVNVTPDSFSGDGVAFDVRRAVERATQLERAGADIIDIGGESTRPGHNPVPSDEELRRVLPALRAIASAVSVPISIDTRKAAVAHAAVEAGAALVNDVSGFLADPHMASTVRSLGVPAVLMARGHSRRADVLARIQADLDESLAQARGAGVDEAMLIVDPGFGFGKDWRDNLELLRRLPEIRSRYAFPLLVGLSRKSVIRHVLGSEVQHRVPANAALTALAIAGGADIVRVHDVEAMSAAVRLADAVIRGPSAAPVEGT